MKMICYLLCLLAGLQNLSAQLLLNGTFEEIEQNTLCENPTPTTRKKNLRIGELILLAVRFLA
ncbi:MAG: hypothetical protein R2798_00915 [Chitinophagales bacterium]